ncbi:MAG: class I SAM-dependent methyltransferase [Acidobacteria bacterium]|nr:class I SAM-dependent methyltransferase [Acidobacteriota bacterium]
MSNPFASAAMAEGYATRRPALHGRIVGSALGKLGMESLGDVVVDIGSGSGLSTKPLIARARVALGIEPVWEMARCARVVAPGAWFINGQGERMPLGDGTVDAMTAAGSLNFADPVGVLREARRCLKAGGVLVAYDFAQGRTFAEKREGSELGGWFAEFVRRYPREASEAIALDPATIRAMAEGFEVAGRMEFAWSVPYHWAAYAGYMMTETNVAAAVRRGERGSEIEEWLNATLPDVFAGRQRDVLFPGYWVALRKR